ncbi:MAG: SH3 domain-containing protein [Bacteriovoracia bacterium]
MLSLSASASQIVRVLEPLTPVFEKPNASARITDRLPRDAKVTASNTATQGFFKIKTPRGKLGWVRVTDVKVPERKVMPRGETSLPRAQSAGTSVTTGRPPEKSLNFLFHMGLDFYKLQEFSDLTGFPITAAFHFGLEGDLFISSNVFIGLRADLLRHTERVEDDDSAGTIYKMDVSSVPIMLGVGARLPIARNWAWEFSGFGGLAFNTELLATVENATEPNQTLLTASTFTALLHTHVAWSISDNFAIFLGGGYRILKTKNLTPTVEGNGNQIFRQGGDVDADYVPIPINLSGVYLDGGISFSF